jgi:dTDP-4-amino-4,6-dideoxygalactose transaminase
MKPSVGKEEKRAINKVLGTGFFTQGPVSRQFESLLALDCNSKYAFVTSSATTALSLSLTALGVGPGDEVLVADFSFPATANAVIAVGAVPVPCDVRLDDYGIDPDKIIDKISNKTKGIIPVHCFGLPCDMERIMEIASSKKLFVLEDAACAIGAQYQGKHAGTLGTAGVFSFHPRKLITTGEGGAILCNNDEIAERIRILRTHGSRNLGTFLEFIEPGFNYRMSDINAAMGIEQLKKLYRIIKGREKLAQVYDLELGGNENIMIPKKFLDRTHTYQSYVIRLIDYSEKERNGIILKLRNEGIEATLGTYSISSQPYFRKIIEENNFLQPENSKLAQSTTITLPLHGDLKRRDIAKISSVLIKLLKKNDLYKH